MATEHPPLQPPGEYDPPGVLRELTRDHRQLLRRLAARLQRPVQQRPVFRRAPGGQGTYPQGEDKGQSPDAQSHLPPYPKARPAVRERGRAHSPAPPGAGSVGDRGREAVTQAEGMPALSSSASPEGWGWSRLDASRPRRALEHLAHSEVTPVLVDLVRGERRTARLPLDRGQRHPHHRYRYPGRLLGFRARAEQAARVLPGRWKRRRLTWWKNLVGISRC